MVGPGTFGVGTDENGVTVVVNEFAAIGKLIVLPGAPTAVTLNVSVQLAEVSPNPGPARPTSDIWFALTLVTLVGQVLTVGTAETKLAPVSVNGAADARKVKLVIPIDVLNVSVSVVLVF